MVARSLPHHLAAISTVTWVGATWTVGYLAVPVLFQYLPDRQMAGMLAGKMFTLLSFVAIVCALYLLTYQAWQFGYRVWKQRTFLVTVGMLLLVLVGQFAIQPVMAELKLAALPQEVMQSAFAEKFRMLHGLASILYLIQSLLGIVLVVDLARLKNI